MGEEAEGVEGEDAGVAKEVTHTLGHGKNHRDVTSLDVTQRTDKKEINPLVCQNPCNGLPQSFQHTIDVPCDKSHGNKRSLPLH